MGSQHYTARSHEPRIIPKPIGTSHTVLLLFLTVFGKTIEPSQKFGLLLIMSLYIGKSFQPSQMPLKHFRNTILFLICFRKGSNFLYLFSTRNRNSLARVLRSILSIRRSRQGAPKRQICPRCEATVSKSYVNRHRCPQDGFVDHREDNVLCLHKLRLRVHKRGSIIICELLLRLSLMVFTARTELQVPKLDVYAGPQAMGSAGRPEQQDSHQ